MSNLPKNLNILSDKLTTRECVVCGDYIMQYKSENPRKYCSRECYNKVCIKNLGNRFTGLKHKAKSIQKIKDAQSGIKNYAWKGDDAGYQSIHKWVRRFKGLPKACSKCGLKRERQGRAWNVEWANIDHKYRRNLNDYIALCIPHHKEHDIELKKQNKLNGIVSKRMQRYHAKKNKEN